MCLLNEKCPIPIEQQPLNEYFSLKDSWLFSISTYSWKRYIKYVASLYSILLIVIFFILLCCQPFNSIKNFWKFLYLDFLIVDIVITCFCIRLYLGWSYVCKRLLSATVFYEESGWYDGQIWVKTSESLIQDRLIGLYEVNPSIKKIQYTFFVCLFLFIFQYIIYTLL